MNEETVKDVLPDEEAALFANSLGKVSRDGEHLVISLTKKGALPVSQVKEFSALLNFVLEMAPDWLKRKQLIVDFSGVEQLPTGCLSALLDAQKKLSRQGGDMVITETSGAINEMIHKTALDSILTLAPHRSDAEKRLEMSGGVGI